MVNLAEKEMDRIAGGDYELCGVGVVLTVASLWYFPLWTAKLAEATAIACATAQ